PRDRFSHAQARIAIQERALDTGKQTMRLGAVEMRSSDRAMADHELGLAPARQLELEHPSRRRQLHRPDQSLVGAFERFERTPGGRSLDAPRRSNAHGSRE